MKMIKYTIFALALVGAFALGKLLLYVLILAILGCGYWELCRENN